MVAELSINKWKNQRGRIDSLLLWVSCLSTCQTELFCLKQRYRQHKLSFRSRNYSNSTKLSKHIWTLKDNNTNFTINWSILTTAPAYSNKSKPCYLCLTEKLYLIRAKKPSLLNKRTELISKCRHENKFYLANFTSRQQ